MTHENQALSELWKQAQRKAELYKITRYPEARAEAAALLWKVLELEGCIVARRKLPRWLKDQTQQVAQDAAASLVAAKGFTLMLESHSGGEGASLRTWLAHKLDWKIADYARHGKWYDKPLPYGAADGPANEDNNSLQSPEEKALAQHAEELYLSGEDDMSRALIGGNLWRIAKNHLNEEELSVLSAHLELSDQAGADELKIPLGTYKYRLQCLRAKLGKVYTDLP